MTATYVRYADGGNQTVYWVEDGKTLYLSPEDSKVIEWINSGNEILPFQIE
jgi:hypothetical protein